MPVRNYVAYLALAVVLTAPAHAQEALVTYKSLSTEVALDLARASLAECRKRGYQAAVEGVWAPAKRSRSITCVTPKRSTTATAA